MKWTTTRPTQSGYYWAVMKFGNNPYIVKIEIQGDLLIDEDGYLINTDNVISWAGPIPLPEGEINDMQSLQR